MAPTSILEGSQLSFPDDDDDELHRDFMSRPLSRTKPKRKKQLPKMSPVEQLQFQRQSPHKAMERPIPRKSMERSPHIPRKKKRHPLSSSGKKPSHNSASSLKQHHPEPQPASSTTKRKKPSLNHPIPRKQTSTKKHRTAEQLDLSSSRLEIPYALNFGGTTTPHRTKTKVGLEPLRVGDVIHYNNPLFVAGTKQAIAVTQILAIDASVMMNDEDEDTDVYPLDLANGQMIPTDTYIMRIQEYRDGTLFPHYGMRRKLMDFRLVSGKLPGRNGLERRMDAFRSIIAQAQQQLEDELEQPPQPPEDSSDNEDSSTSSSSEDSSVIVRKRSITILQIESPKRPSPEKRSPQKLLLSKAKGKPSKNKSFIPTERGLNSTSKGLFDDSSDEEALMKSSEVKRNKSILEDSSSSSEEDNPASRVCTKAQLERRRKSRGSDQSRKSHVRAKRSVDHNRPGLSKTSPSTCFQRKDVNQRSSKKGNGRYKDATTTKKAEKTSRSPPTVVAAVKTPFDDDDTSDDDDDKLPAPIFQKRKSDSSRSTASFAAKTQPSTTVKTKGRIKSFLDVSPPEGDAARRSKEVSTAEKKTQKEEFDRLLRVASKNDSKRKKPMRVKQSKTSSFYPRTVEDASSCNEYNAANQSSSDEDDDSFFRSKKKARSSTVGTQMIRPSKDDGGSITTTFSNSQSSMEKKQPRLSGLKRPIRPRSQKMELKLQPIPQDDDWF